MASVTSQEQRVSDTDPDVRAASLQQRSGLHPDYPLKQLTGVQILATGGYAPDHIVRNEDLAALGYDADWIVQRTGILERRRADDGIATSDIALPAAVACLEQADVHPRDVDLLLVGTMTPDHPTPSTACRIAERLGIRAPAMDVNAACAGFMYATVTGMQFVKAGTAECALVVGADIMSRICDPEDKKTYPLFGDAAGAVLLGKGDARQGLISYTLGADGAGGDLLCIPAGGSREPVSEQALAAKRQYMQMEGRPVFQWAVQMLRETILCVLEGAQLNFDDIDLVVLHQANARIIDSAIGKLGMDRDKVFVNLDRYGNTSAGSIPLALDEAHRQGRIRRGDHIIVSGFGAGLAWGTAVLRW